MRSVRMLAFFLALVLVASELSQLAAAGKGGGKKKGAAKKVDSKVKRTITVKATKPPPSEPEAQDQEAPPEQPEKNVGLHNEGPTNTIDMQPSISIGTPMPQASVAQPGHEGVEAPTPQQSQPQQTQAPHQQQPQIQAAAPNPIQVDQGPIAQSGGPAVKANDMSVLSNLEQQTMLNQANNQLLTSIMDSNNLQQRALANSNNLLMEQLEGNNNMKNTVLTNSGNTESVHIDGVGNSKTTHITNANNHEHHSVTNGPQPTTTTATGGLGGLLSNHLDVPSAGAALITINVNSGEPFLGQARAPIVVLPDGSQWPGGVNSQFTGLQTAPQASVDPLASSLAGGAPSVLPHAPGQAPTAAMGTPAPVFLPAAGPMPVFFPPPMFHPLPAPHPMPILHPLPAPHPMPILHPLPAPHLVPILHPLPGPHPVPILHPVFHGPHHQEPPHHKSLEKAAKSAKKSLKKIDKKMNKLEKLEKRLKKSMKSDKKMEPTEPTPTPNPTPSPAPSTESKPETQQLVQQQAEQPPKQVVPVQPAEAQLGEEEDAEASSTGEEDTGESPQLVEDTQESQGAAEEEHEEHEEPEEPEERDERGYVMKMIRVPVDKARDNYSRIPSLNRITEAADDAADSVQVPSIGDNMRSPVHY